MKTWAVITQKGGSGKTTIALHLGIVADSLGKRAVVVDVDPQRSAMKWSMIRGTGRPPVIATIVPELRRELAKLERTKTDLVIIDTSPRADRDSLEVSRIADLIVVPVKPSILDLPAAQETLELIRAAGAASKTVIVLNSVPASTTEARDAAAVLRKFGHLLPGSIGDRVDFRRALVAGKGVTEFAPNSAAAKEINTLYLALASISAI